MRADSDYDVAVFLADLTDRGREFHRLADLRASLLAETGVFLEARPYRAAAYRDRTPLMHQIRRDGSICEARNRANIWIRRGRHSRKGMQSQASNSPMPLAEPLFTPRKP
jgi:hypothetical protein